LFFLWDKKKKKKNKIIDETKRESSIKEMFAKKLGNYKKLKRTSMFFIWDKKKKKKK